MGAFTQAPGFTASFKDVGILYINILKLEMGKLIQANMGLI